MSTPWGEAGEAMLGGVPRASLEAMLRDLWPPFRDGSYEIQTFTRLYNIGMSTVRIRFAHESGQIVLFLPKLVVAAWYDKHHSDWREGFNRSGPRR